MTLSRFRSRLLRSLPGAVRSERPGRRGLGMLFALTLCGAALLPTQLLQAQDTNAGANGSNQEHLSNVGRLTAPFAVNWKFTGNVFPNNPVAPVISQDTAYIACGNRLYAISLQNGTLKWRYPSDTSLSTVIQTTPAFDGTTLYVGAGDGLYAVSATDGKVKWHFFLKSRVSTSPQVTNNRVYFTADDGRFYEVDARTGDALQGIWHKGNQAGVAIGADMTADFVLANDLIYYVTSDAVLHSTSLTAGTQRWATRMDGDAEFPPVVSGETLYLATGNTVSKWRAATGQRRWVVPLPTSAAAAPAVDSNGNVYVVTNDRFIYALDVYGKPLWKQRPRLDYEVAAPPIVADQLLIVGTTQGGVYAFDVASGTLKWNYQVHPSGTDPDTLPTSTNVMTSPIVSGSNLFVMTDDGSLTNFRHEATDTAPPAVTVLEPALGDYLNGRPPFRISAKIADEGSGVNLDTLSIKLDNRSLPRRPGGIDDIDKPGYYFDPETSTIEYVSQEAEGGKSNALPDGHHTLTIAVKDWKGNAITKTTSFFTDDTLPRRARRTATGAGGVPGRGGSGGPGGGGLGGGGGKGGGGGGN